MTKTIKIEIEIPAPPEGWGDIEFRHVMLTDKTSRFWNGAVWVECHGLETEYQYPVARKLVSLWTPPPELVAAVRPGWIAMDRDGGWWWYETTPELSCAAWQSTDVCHGLGEIKPNLLPNNVPWEKCCFKIDEPKE